MILEKIINNPIKRITKKVAKLFTGVALATATFFGNAQTPVQQESTALEEKVKTEKYVLLRKFGSEGSKDSQFKWVEYLDIDNCGNVYVVDTLNYRIQKFDKNGNFIKKWGSYGEGDGEFRCPVGIAIDNDFIYVSEQIKYIQKFDLDGNFIAKWNIGAGSMGDLDIGSLGNVYANAGTYSTFVKKFDSDGSFLKEWGADCCADSKGLNGIAVDNCDNVYVPCEYKIKKFTSDGDFIMEFGLVDEDNRFLPFAPRGIAFDSQSNIYACDEGSHHIIKFDSNGNFITRISETDSGRPWSVGVNNEGLVYVTGNNHIKKFVKLPVIDIKRESDTVTMGFESPPSFTHRVFRSSDLENWEQINVLKSSGYQNWINAKKFYSTGKTWIQDPEVPTTQTFYEVSIQEPDFRVADGIEYCLETDKPSYRWGEKVDMLYRITNHQEGPVTFNFSSLVQVFFTGEKNGKIYYASARDVPDNATAISSITLAHNEFREFNPELEGLGIWKIEDNEEEIGRYNLTGVLNSRTVDRYVPVTITIDVVE